MNAKIPYADMGTARFEQARGFYPSLEASRGIAALMVALFHAGQSNYLNAAGHTSPLIGGHDLVLRIAGNGGGAVIFFFVLSGFVLTLMLQRGSQNTSVAASRFFLSRIFRVFPASVSTVILFAFLYGTTGLALDADAYSLGNLVANALLFRSDVNGVMWSLQLEMIAAPLIFVAFLMHRRWGAKALVGLLLLFAGLSFAGAWNKLLGAQIALGPLYCFLAGMLACVVGRKRWSGPGAMIGLMIGVIGFGAARPLLGWTSNWAVVVETLCASILLVALSYGHLAWRGARPLARLFSFYGHISFSFYLLHPLTLLWLWKNPGLWGNAVAAGWPPQILACALFAISTATITPLAWAQQRLIERTGISAGRRLIDALATKSQIPQKSHDRSAGQSQI